MDIKFPTAPCSQCGLYFTILQLIENKDGKGYLCKGCAS